MYRISGHIAFIRSITNKFKNQKNPESMEAHTKFVLNNIETIEKEAGSDCS